MPPRPFLNPAQLGDVSLAVARHLLDLLLYEADRTYPDLVARGVMTASAAGERYRGLVGARRVVLDAMQLSLPLKGVV